MKRRCRNPSDKSYLNYGARGIKVCEKWKRDFSAFLTDVGPRPKGYWLERVNNNGNYEPSNVKWATPKQQMKNRRPPKIICPSCGAAVALWGKQKERS